MNDINDLNPIAESIRAGLSAKNAARDKAITQSRELIRHCAESIRATHRREWQQVDAKLGIIQQHAAELRAVVAAYPELYYSGYMQDALKEVVEAHITSAIIREQPIPTPAELEVEGATYLNGLAEAATELRRFILDIMRLAEQHSDEAERLLEWMDTVYDHLVTFDFPDALTGGLRRQTDVVRGVLERTRGDMTLSLRQQRLQQALAQFEARSVTTHLTNPDEMKNALNMLYQSLARTMPTDAQSADTLAALQTEVQMALETDQHPPTLRQRLETAVLQFEVGHPELTLQMQAVINALANAGV
jgi:translin